MNVRQSLFMAAVLETVFKTLISVAVIALGVYFLLQYLEPCATTGSLCMVPVVCANRTGWWERLGRHLRILQAHLDLLDATNCLASIEDDLAVLPDLRLYTMRRRTRALQLIEQLTRKAAP
jgi:hypothetical protein